MKNCLTRLGNSPAFMADLLRNYLVYCALLPLSLSRDPCPGKGSPKGFDVMRLLQDEESPLILPI